ncbi:hypothetical protein PIN31009_03000 [Pandoraea iniqua]|uniref:hypothetical protein n=1 Tax=Pandoraea iniqua TaxID=2508288 RepID=UPI0012425392|nr:hypothetical protein [Pandoraea iniqua]VVE18382.1 hypothetical protein PIN31009_03000 [Pandoraea iniqua]
MNRLDQRAQPTPGAWHFSVAPVPHPMSVECVTGKGVVQICELKGSFQYAIANGRILATAKDLLESLEVLLDRYGGEIEFAGGEFHVLSAKAVVDKARGVEQ